MPASDSLPRLAPPEIAAALAEGRIALAFQPVLPARPPLDRAAFYEALLRLHLPGGGVVGPGQFLTGLSDPVLRRALDRRALALGLAELAAEPGLRLSVNVDPQSLTDPGWQSVMDTALARDPQIAERLILEITEHAPLPPLARIRGPLSRWRARGVSLALDDFGAGFTALRHLRSWRFDIVKIDGSFSRHVHRDPDHRAVIQALVGLARHFEALCVAEAVETRDEANQLAKCGVDALQGYHCGKPALIPPWRSPAPATATG